MARAKCYHTMDAFVKLVVVLVRYSGDHSNTITKVNLLNKVHQSYAKSGGSGWLYVEENGHSNDCIEFVIYGYNYVPSEQ